METYMYDVDISTTSFKLLMSLSHVSISFLESDREASTSIFKVS